MLVATPWPLARRPPARSVTVTSPSASSPPVTAPTRYSRGRSHPVSAASWIALKIASTGLAGGGGGGLLAARQASLSPWRGGRGRDPSSTSNEARL